MIQKIQKRTAIIELSANGKFTFAIKHRSQDLDEYLEKLKGNPCYEN
jgi:hypothetical protein